MRHCILGRTRFPFGRIHVEYGTKGPTGRKKKLNINANYERQEEHANGIFHKEIVKNVPISHNGENVRVP